MHLSDYVQREGASIATLARELGCSRSYLTHVAARRKPLSRRLAIALWRARKVKLEPIAHVADADMPALARSEQAA